VGVYEAEREEGGEAAMGGSVGELELDPRSGDGGLVSMGPTE
jgi:hypothetical protein